MKLSPIKIFLLLGLGLVFLSGEIPAQPAEYPHPKLKWYTIESDHFEVYYHEGTERTAFTLLKIAEEVYGPITELFQYEPKSKIRVVVKDTDDYSNGGAYYYDNKILIWVNSMDWDLRGTHNWLRNVFTHEFSHIIQLGASRKLPRRIPALYFQWLNYEDERRPDVLYGFPNVIMSYPVAMTQCPVWFAEGVAQNQAPGFGYDTFDSHRDMILRTRTLTGTLLTLDEMGAFGKNTIGNESVYNQGFSLTGFIRRNCGDAALRDISRAMAKFTNFSFDKALEDAIGVRGPELYALWKDSLEHYYREATSVIADNMVEGERLQTGGYGSFYPNFISEDEIVFISNEGMDYMSLTGLFKKNLTTGETTRLSGVARSRPAVSPDGKWVAYSKKKGVIKGSHFEDIFLFSLERNQEYRLTRGARTFSPAFSPDGKSLVFAVNNEGTRNLALAELPDLKGKKVSVITAWKLLTEFKEGEQIYNPLFTPDGEAVIFAFAYDGPRDICRYDMTDGEITYLRNEPFDERNPALSPDGRKLIYSSDKTGIYNVYSLDLGTGEEELLTNVVGGAFMGSFSSEGKLVYSGYRDNGFRIFLIEDPRSLNPETAVYKSDYASAIPVPGFNDRELPDFEPEKYKPGFGGMFWLPRLTYDLHSFKPGVYFYNTDFLDWFFFMGGFSFNGLTEEPRVFQSITRLNPQYLGDYDLFAILEYTNIKPNIFIEAYHIVRRSHQEFEDEFVIVGEKVKPSGEIEPIYDHYAVDYRFSLNEVDAGFRLRLNDANIIELRGIYSQYRAKLRFDEGFSPAYTYFRGKSVSLKWERDYRLPGINQDIHPDNGGQLIAEFAREYTSFIEGFTVESGLLKEVFTPYDYNRLSVQWEHYMKSPLRDGHAVNLRFNGGLINRDDVDDFFYLYAGGLPGLKGYSYYSLGGTRKLVGTLTYRFPIFKTVNKRWLQAYVHNLYFGLFIDYGDAWVGKLDLSDWKKDIGFSLRTQLTSFFTYPTAISLEVAYGLDKFTIEEDNFKGTYGRELRYYLTVLFNFNLMLGGKNLN